MSLETEAVLDRRRLKRKTSFWRALAVAAFVVAIAAVGYTGRGRLGIGETHQIARVTVEGLITEDRAQLRMLKRIADAKHVDGVILVVNSPGGTTTGGEALFEAIRALAEKKPVVAQFGTVAASAAYIAGLATDHIVARGNSITGSVGVIMQWPEVSELLAKLGIKMNEIKSGPLKASPSIFQPIDEPSRQVTEQMIRDGQQWFLGLVTTRRGVRTAEIPGLEQGRVFSGREALKFKLVDEIGGETEAVKWLQDTRNVKKNLRIVDWKPQREGSWSFTGAMSRLIGGSIAEAVRGSLEAAAQETGLSTFQLDGFVSVWHPGKN